MHLINTLVLDRQQDTILSAGEVTVRITDWFFIKKNIDLKYIGLKDAVVKLQRDTDSVWRHQFLIDYFSSPTPTTKKKKSSISLGIKQLDCTNVLFWQHDAWVGQDMKIYFANLTADARVTDFENKRVAVESIIADKPQVSLSVYKGNKSVRPRTTTPSTRLPQQLEWNKGDWAIEIGRLKLTNGSFTNDNLSVPEGPAGIFNGQHIAFNDIDLTLKNIWWQKDTISTQITLSTKERSGFEIKKLEANAKVTPREMSFADLLITTNNSTISDYYSMRYDQFSDMSDFINKITLVGDFKNTEIDSDDIAFFAPALSDWNRRINLSGKFSGPISNLSGRDFLVEAGANTRLKGHISLVGLPDINETFIDFSAEDFKTTYAEAATFVPLIKTLKKPDLSQLEYIHFNGNFTGFIRDFVTFGTIKTALGTVKTDLNMKLAQGRDPVYSGTLSSDNFMLGKLLHEPLLGSIAFNSSLKGSGTQEKRRIAEFKGDIKYIDFNSYRYQNIHLNGHLNKNEFDGVATINDENVKLNLNGLINLNDSLPVFNFIADVQESKIKNLKLTDEDIGFSGKINANFSGKTIDDFLGTANITDAQLTHNDLQLPFDSLTLSSAFSEGKKILSLHTNELKASVKGNYTIRELPDAFKVFLNNYYPAYIAAPRINDVNEQLDFTIETGYIDDYLKLFTKKFSGFNHSNISGSLNTIDNSLTLTANVPQFKYLTYNFDNVTLNGKGGLDTLVVNGNASNIMIGDSLNVPLATFDITAFHDTSYVNILTGANQGIDQAKINAAVLTYHNGVRIEMNPSNLVVNGKTWTIDENGELEFRKNAPAIGELRLRENNQEIVIKTLPSEIGEWNDVSVKLSKVNLGDFGPFIMPRNRLEGLASGDVLIENPFNDLRVISNNFKGEYIRLDNDSIGEVNASVIYENKTGELFVNGKNANPDHGIAFDIHLFLQDKVSQQKNVIDLTAKTFQLKYLERFLGTLFSDMNGYITGKFSIKGPFDNLDVTGKGRLTEAGLKVKFTQCYYTIDDREIELKSGEINLDGITLKDPVSNNPVYLTGSILHSGFKNLFFDLAVSTRKPGTQSTDNNRPILLLNTTYNDNKQFYGKVKGTGSFTLSGQESDLYMKIDAIASTTDSSSVTIPSSNSKASGMADFLIERKFGREMVDSNFIKGSSNIVYDVDITANNMVTVRVILDDYTGDEIKGKGSGTLNIRSGSAEPLSMRGKFNIEEGNYLFTFQSFFKKPFELKKGGNSYISWTGDPTNAQINFEAQYKAERVSFAPLIAGLNLEQSNYADRRENVYVYANLTGQLFDPEFKFSLGFEPNSGFKNDFSVAAALQQMENDPNQINKQVTYLIVFNSFAPPETGQAGTAGLGSAINEFTYSTISSISGIIFNEINKKLNSELSKILKTDKVSLNFSGSVYNYNPDLVGRQQQGGFNINQSNLNLNIPISLFKDRLVVTLGNTLDVPLQASLQQTIQYLPDVTAEWLINQSGTIRVSFFYRENLDYLTNNNRNKRSGASISYRKEFDSFREFLKRKKKKQPEADTKAQAQP